MADPGQADALVLPERLPRALAPAVGEARLRLPRHGPVRTMTGPDVGGEPVAEVLGELPAPGGGVRDHRGSQGGDGHEDHDMMAVTGEPSADGLIMESAEAVAGPLAAGVLPTGIALGIELDGDVVCRASVSSALELDADPLSPSANRWAVERGAAGSPQSAELIARRLAAVETERALSHSAWLARFTRLLGWPQATERLEGAIAPLVAAQRRFLEDSDPDGPGDCEELEALLGSLIGSRRLARRTEGLAAVGRRRAHEAGLRGPNARAAGIETDSRLADPAYLALDFAIVTRAAGDARARAELRAEEALASLALARAALQAGALPVDASSEVEGPRGALTGSTAGPDGSPAVLIRGGTPSRRTAEAAVAGLELGRALAAVASFDIAPGRSGP